MPRWSEMGGFFHSVYRGMYNIPNKAKLGRNIVWGNPHSVVVASHLWLTMWRHKSRSNLAPKFRIWKSISITRNWRQNGGQRVVRRFKNGRRFSSKMYGHKTKNGMSTLKTASRLLAAVWMKRKSTVVFITVIFMYIAPKHDPPTLLL